MLKSLVKLANRLDSLGLTKEADIIDREIVRFASASTEPADADDSVENLEKIFNLDSYERWVYMTKDGGKNNDYLQGLDINSLPEKKQELLLQIFDKCAEDFSNEEEYAKRFAYEEEERSAIEALENEPKISDEQLRGMIGDMEEEQVQFEGRRIPSYKGHGVSVFGKRPDARSTIRPGDQMVSVRKNKVRMPDEENIHVFDLPKELKLKKKPAYKDLSMTEEQEQSFLAQLDSILGREGKLSGAKKKHTEKVKKIDALKEKLKKLKEEVASETDSEKKDKIRDDLDNTIDKLNNLLIGSSVSQTVEESDESEEAGDSGKKLSEYTVSDIDFDNYYVFKLMTRPGTKKKFFVAMGEFVDEEQANDFAEILREGSDDEEVRVLDGYDAKELVTSGEGRFRLEAWSGGKLPSIKRERDGINPRHDPEKDLTSGAIGFGDEERSSGLKR